MPRVPAHAARGFGSVWSRVLEALNATSVRGALALTIGTLLFMAVGTALFTRYHLTRRVHDYAILTLSGQLRELANGMRLDARQLESLPPTLQTPDAVEYYRVKLTAAVEQYERIVQSFVTRELRPDLTGLDAPVSCNWDSPSLSQLERSAATWRIIHRGIAPATRPGATREEVLEAAEIVSRHGGRLLESSRSLNYAFKTMMQQKLDRVILTQLLSVLATCIIGLLLIGLVRRHVLAPLVDVERLATRVMSGDLATPVQVAGSAEIAAIGEAMNALTQRIRLLFTLSEQTAAGMTTSELLTALQRELATQVPVDLTAVAVRTDGDRGGWRVLRAAGELPEALADRRMPLAEWSSHEVEGALNDWAHSAGYASSMTVRLNTDTRDGSVLLFAAREPSAYAEPNATLLRAVAEHVRTQIERTFSTDALIVAAVEGLARLAESRDPETGNHLVRMSAYSALVAEELVRAGAHADALDARFVDEIRRFAPMHDIGKVGVPDGVLRKAGALDADERAEMQRHPSIGAEVLQRCEAQMSARGRTVFRRGIEIAVAHHERWDGTGYPNQLAGEAIPLAARVVAIADVFDALTSRRPYKEPWSVDRAVAWIAEGSGTQFDPQVVVAFERALPRITQCYLQYRHVG
ncbi:MAG: HD domain-containing protein [Gemmatimonadetes bacterium]|nr:HD domain-containing protein [Gemmatimonadota bacterium]